MSDFGEGFTWSAELTDPQDGTLDFNLETGLVTVTGVAPLGSATVVVHATKDDFVPAEQSQQGFALAAPGTPILGDVTQKTGFTFPITNYFTDNNNTNYTWSVDPLTAPANVVIDDTVTPALVRVTGLTQGQGRTSPCGPHATDSHPDRQRRTDQH